MVQAILAMALAVTAAVPEHRRVAATAIAAGFVLASLALTGHAVMHQGWLRLAQMANDALHVLAGGAWIGALIPLAVILRDFERPDRRLDAALALRRFSFAGHIPVALVVCTGAINTALILGRWPMEWTSPYQALLAAKIGLVALMTGIAIANRYGLVRRMKFAPAASIRMLANASMLELGLSLGVLALVSVLGTLQPA
jgi:putative copper resistance protein D